MLSQRPEIDLVMILNANEYHVSVCRSVVRCVPSSPYLNSLYYTQAIHAIQCLSASKHVFIEKPMCLSHEDAQAIEAARVESGRICFVGYMRRYATAFLRVKEAIQGMEIKYVRVRDLIGKVGKRGWW
jgi:predicted dehydrogenase